MTQNFIERPILNSPYGFPGRSRVKLLGTRVAPELRNRFIKNVES
jgi:hypothetical protein